MDVALIDPVFVATSTKGKSGLRLGRWTSLLLLHPKTLGKPVWEQSDLVLHKFEFHSLPKGATALPIFRIPLPLKGVITVHPDLMNEAITVIGRRGEVDFEAIGKAFATAGHEPLEEETEDE